jgi:hypothetical protein
MKRIWFLFLFLGLSGCATTLKYETKLNSWIGASEDSLIASWGVPDRQYTLKDGKRAIEYVRKDTITSGGYAYTIPQTTYHSGTIGDKAYKGTSTEYVVATEPVQKFKLFCKTSFVINSEGKVESWHHEGNNCVAQ